MEGGPEEDGCVGQVVQEVVVTLLRAKKETMNKFFVKTGSVKDAAGVCAQPKSGLT